MGNLVDKIKLDNGITNRGDLTKLKKVMKRALAGDKITLGFLGGSITQGSVASKPELCYAYRVYKWWCDTFPKAEFTYVNAGIGATTSQFGAARVGDDLLSHEPDFAVVEFSVNDESNEHFMETYEGLVRRILKSSDDIALMLIHNVCYDNGSSAQLVHSKVGRHYQLPAVSMQSTIYPELLNGNIENRLITPDDLHPNDEGHELVASVVCNMLKRVLDEVEKDEAAVPDELPAPITKNRYENSIRIQNDSADVTPELSGFEADKSAKDGITDIFKKGWTAGKKGDAIIFDIEARGLALQYRRTPQKPAPIAKVVIDGEEENACYLDANFDEDWGELLALETVMEPGELKRHRVEITIAETHEDDKKSFYLVSIIAAK